MQERKWKLRKLPKNRKKICKIGSGDPRMALNRPCKHSKLNKNQNNCLKFEGKLKKCQQFTQKIPQKTNGIRRKCLKFEIKSQTS